MGSSKLTTFDFKSGIILSKKYQIVELLGSGWEAEVYKLRELDTGIERAGKFFYPHRNQKNKSLLYYAKKLHKLTHCSILIQYHTQETMSFHGNKVNYLVSEYVEGPLLSEFLKKQSGKRLPAFQGLHLLHALAKGMAEVHQAKEYHGDLHSDNVIIQRHGLGFELKLLDIFHWHGGSAENMIDDVTNMIKIFHEAIGGPSKYPSHPRWVKDICCGLKRSLIATKFKNAGQLRQYLERMDWKS